MRKGWLLGLILCAVLCGAAHAAQVAVAEIAEADWYKAKREAGQLSGVTMTRGYGPFAVFGEAWKSTPRADIVSYVWDWGDGSADSQGYCAVHVYPNPGTYTLTLTVTAKDGTTAAASRTVEVVAPSGYRYVDALTGSDDNNGTEGHPWRTATKVATVARTQGGLPAGTCVVFTDDQVYDLYPGVWTSVRAVGVTFKRSGTGTARPLIRRTVNPADEAGRNRELIKIAGADILHCAWWGLQFDGLSADHTAFGTVFAQQGRGCGTLFYECSVYNGSQLIGFNTSASLNTATNCYVVDCEGGNPGVYDPDSGYFGQGSTLFYGKALRWGWVDNRFDYSANHILYGSWGRSVVVTGNRFRYPAFGRHCVRVAGASDDFGNPTSNVVVRDNELVGWIDPLNGPDTNGNGKRDGAEEPWGDPHNPLGQSRYNGLLLQVGPQERLDQSIEYVEIAGNTLTDGETAIEVSAASHVRIAGNTITTASRYQASPRLQLGGNGFERRPLYDVVIEGNAIETAENRLTGKGILVAVYPYAKAAWGGMSRHTGIVIRNNDFRPQGAIPWGLHLPADAAARAEIVTANNWTGVSRTTDSAVMVGGTWNGPGTQYTLDAWHGLTGNEPAAGGEPELPPATPPGQASKRVGVLR